MRDSPALGPLVSIVTPTLNQAMFIRDTIESIAAQDYPEIEHIVIDGGSTDGTQDILKQYGERITWISEPDDGQSAALNKGFSMAHGEILTWLNSDDALLPGAVSAAVAEFERDQGLGLVYGDGYLTDENGGNPMKLGALEPNLWFLQNVCCYVLQPAAFFRREALEEAGGLDDTLNWTMDYDLWLKIMRRYRTSHVPKTFATARFYGACKTASGGVRRYREIIHTAQRNGGRRYSWANLLYGFEALVTVAERSWELALARRSKRAGSLQSRTMAACERFNGVIVRRTMDRWPDGWVKQETRLQSAVACDGLRLEGEVPSVPSLLRGQSLRFVRDGKEIAEVLVPPGSFRLDLALGSRPEGELVVRAKRTLHRSELPKEERRRKLAFRLTSVEPAVIEETRLHFAEAPTGFGWYPDGWLAPRALLWVRPLEGRVALVGEAPEWCPEVRGQTLRLTWNGRSVCKKAVHGDFNIDFSAETDGNDYGCLEVTCSRWFVPLKEGTSTDDRALAVLIRRVAGVELPPAKSEPLGALIS